MDGWFALGGVVLGFVIGQVSSQLESRRRRAEHSDLIPDLRIANENRARFVDEIHRECQLMDGERRRLANALKEPFSDTLGNDHTPRERQKAYVAAIDQLSEHLERRARRLIG